MASIAAKSLTAEARDARKLRDSVYTLVINTERRLRAAAEYWQLVRSSKNRRVPRVFADGYASPASGASASNESAAETS